MILLALAKLVGSLDCFYCNNGYSSRCANGALFGTAALDGAQAEYVLRRRPWVQDEGLTVHN